MDSQSSILFSTILGAEPKFNVVLFVIMLCLVMMSAFFSMSETAFSSSSDIKLRIAVEERRAGAKKALLLTERFDKTVTTLLIGNNLVNTGLSTIAVTFFVDLAIDGNWVELVSTLVVTVTLLIFGEIVPKMIAKLHPEAICLKVSFIVYLLSFLFYPFVMFFVGIQKLIHRNKEEQQMDESELEVIIDKMEEDGSIENDEATIIRNVFDLNDRTVEDIMVPRIKMEALEYSTSLEEVKAFMLDNAYSRVPVYKKDKDHVVGILYERDFFPALVKNPKMSWKRLIRPVKYVAASMKVDGLIQELQASKTHMAIVSGEYGDVLGLVTMEDALEELVGEIYDEHDVPGDNDIKFEQQEDGSYLVDGEIFVEDLFEKLNVGDIPEDVPSKLSGWLFAKCESLPEVGYTMDYVAMYTMQNEETDEYSDYAKVLTISIHEVRDRRITIAHVLVRDATQEEIDNHVEALDD
ncbi:MAG: HlyC/CorC family transporter [Acholeplasmatales bacterium]|nr:HlyC/CorC family transporter [Acholeplasmatales bacterium]